MTCIISGDIINSRKVDPTIWLNPLKALMKEWGETPQTWEIYRGDSFQLEIKQPQYGLLAAIRIKACVKSIEKLDVRMGIGIGQKSYDAQKITEANGEAFINSGETFEDLKKLKQSLAIRSPWPQLDTELNLMFRLALIALDKWSPATAQIVAVAIANRSLSQKELGDIMERTQSTISEAQKRAHYDEIMDLVSFYEQCIIGKIS